MTRQRFQENLVFEFPTIFDFENHVLNAEKHKLEVAIET